MVKQEKPSIDEPISIKEIDKVIQRCLDYQNAQIDIKMHENIITLLKELKQYREKNEPTKA